MANRSKAERLSVPFTVLCECGTHITGQRQAEFQRVPCPKCQRTVLVFPYSPILALFQGDESAAESAPRWRSLQLWLGFSAGFLVLLLAVVLYWQLPNTQQGDPASARDVDRATYQDLAERALREGDHQRAATIWAELLRATETDPNLLSVEDRRHIRHQIRQAELFADLLPVSLSEVLRRVPATPKRVWDEDFARRFRGKAVIFDGRIHRDAAGQYRFDYVVITPDGEAKIAWNYVKLLQRLPLDEPTRIIFGARLESARRDSVGQWLIVLGADSAELITDEEMFRGTSYPPVDEETKAVLDRQREWVKGFGE